MNFLGLVRGRAMCVVNLLMALFAERHQIFVIIHQKMPLYRVVGAHEARDVMHIYRRPDDPSLGASLAERIVHQLRNAQLAPLTVVVHLCAFRIVIIPNPRLGLFGFVDSRHFA